MRRISLLLFTSLALGAVAVPALAAAAPPAVPKAHPLHHRATALDTTSYSAGYTPADLRSAYSIPLVGVAGRMVAIVDAYNNPTAEADMNVYRGRFGLPLCTTVNGCFR